MWQTDHSHRTAIKEMKDNKTPGTDGLPREFYAQFSHLFQDLFIDVLTSAFANGELSTSQRKSRGGKDQIQSKGFGFRREAIPVLYPQREVKER